ncbi:ABC transporter substrate-binding protein [Paenibacillus ginsengarvi]|uniref:Carbohydrate ABC transporter substrate-binding protein n=1 Tax=Paenibacillus ginsengarvi TaxID=400777 RepID=A0A3B0CI31_9BACL|nr:ABC transporter substrate-binding protein [Paenibacillus ginsengarvi]RKN83969.1 carbohydrate ABC transporter substrate-binding protein [Paenibacillus ginsengarvi]
MFKQYRVWLASMIAVTTLAGCGGNSNSGANSSGPKEAEAPKPRETVEISIFHYNGTWTQEQNEKVFAEPIMKKYPYIKVNAITYKSGKQLEELVVAGTVPDLIISTPGPGFETTIGAFKGQFDLTPLITQNKYDLNQLDSSALGVVRSLAPKNELYSLPIYMAPNTLYYNKNIFDKFGVAYPKDGMNWDEMYELNKRLTRLDGNVQYLGFMLSHVHLMRLNQVSQKLFDSTGEKVAFDTSTFKNYLTDVFRNFQLPGYDLSASNLNFVPTFVKDQTLAMLEPGGTLLGEDLLAELKNQWDFTSYPSMKDKPGVGYQSYPFIISMFNTSKHKQEAFEAMAYLTSKEFQEISTKKGVLLPVLKDRSIVQSFGQENPFYKGKNVGALLPKQFAPVPDEPFSKYTAITQTNLYTIFTKVLKEQKDINTATREATEQANKQIAEAKAAGK